MDQGPSWEANITQLVKKFPAFYGTQKFITCSQEPTTGPFPEPDACSLHLPTLFPKIRANTTQPGLLRYLFPSVSNENFVYISHLSHMYYIVLK